MKKIITILLTTLTLTACTQNTQTIATPIKQNQNAVKSFTQWCEEKLTLAEKTKHTVELLLEKAGTQNCQEANRKLSGLSSLNLWEKKIRDLAPIASLIHLVL